MADKPAKTATRRVKNPETFRERAIKASEVSDQPKRLARFRSGSKRVIIPITSPISRLFAGLGRLRLFKLLAKPLRLIGRIIFPTYFRESWRELRLVKWPSWHESRQLTIAVLGFAVVFGAVIAIVDFGLDKIFRHVLLK